MSKNQHIVDITIIWPDDKWEPAAEQEYLLSCLKGIAEHFERNPIQNKEEIRDIFNALGRSYAEIHVNPCKPVPSLPSMAERVWEAKRQAMIRRGLDPVRR